MNSKFSSTFNYELTSNRMHSQTGIVRKMEKKKETMNWKDKHSLPRCRRVMIHTHLQVYLKPAKRERDYYLNHTVPATLGEQCKNRKWQVSSHVQKIKSISLTRSYVKTSTLTMGVEAF